LSAMIHNNVGSHPRVDFGGAEQPRLGRRSRTCQFLTVDGGVRRLALKALLKSDNLKWLDFNRLH
jgi:hypothetical protein